MLLLRTKNIRYFRILLFVFITAELFVFGMPFIGTASEDDVYAAGEEVKEIAKDGGVFRVLDLDDELKQSVAVQHGIQLIGGYDPMITADYYAYAAEMGGLDVKPRETLPLDSIVDKRMLDFLNVKYVLSDNAVEGFEHVSGRMYINKEYMPRAFVVPSKDMLEDYSEAEVVYYSPNRIKIKTDGTGLLVLSENYFPGWKAYVNGEEVKVYKVNKIQRAVFVRDEDSEVEFVYRPLSYRIGMAVSLITLLVLGVLGLLKWKKIM